MKEQSAENHYVTQEKKYENKEMEQTFKKFKDGSHERKANKTYTIEVPKEEDGNLGTGKKYLKTESKKPLQELNT